MFFRTRTFFLAQFLLSFLGLGLFHTLYASENDILEISDILVHQTEVNRVLSVPASNSLSALDHEDFFVLDLDTVGVTKSNHSSNLARKKVSPLDLKDQVFPILIENRFLHLNDFNFNIPFFFYWSSQNFISSVTILAKNSVSFLEKTDVCLFVLDRRQLFNSKNCMFLFLLKKDPFNSKLFIALEDSLLYFIGLEKNTMASQNNEFHLARNRKFLTDSHLNLDVQVERLKSFLLRSVEFEEKLSATNWKQKNEPFVFWQAGSRVCNFIDRLFWKLRNDKVVLTKGFKTKVISVNVKVPLNVRLSTNKSIRIQNSVFQFNNLFYQNSVVG
ncbi:hypothetical protein [Leptospira kirschneri]|uniref:hypothetical protein n=1 Tax=Leptospira kirschneri TaxID=29507 RepID=UPI00027853F7|nr:hypothetical protein [Leptospira kirschneri]EJO67969.1 hypothetical protein LEP1GSC044_0540 [Leptospira kirschneri serovar Grippotyphosa str. RM52]EKQ85456.1 hypothetical protein LEP1GSC064_0666 [Leptospira kirschneri serovar Grippotyphosa str. Moskva]EKR09280.1 hypothetical protein LEP1GSC122_0274 [Leptospira kirschneri serovar Valbuzzi str. 200702274]EMK05389.1 hypothetical protein LEP1GSC176_2279 [Leptospira kirschneri str. MMD1493]OOV49515.1 hypothetical protein B1J94_05720 [Leptospira 